MRSNVNKLRKLEPGVLIRAIGRSAAIKAQVVSEDEKERESRRTITDILLVTVWRPLLNINAFFTGRRWPLA